MPIPRQKILVFWALTTAIPRIRLSESGPVKERMATREWQSLGSKEQRRLRLSLESDRTQALAQTLVNRKHHGHEPASYTELVRSVWGEEDDTYTFDAKRMAIKTSVKTLKYFGLAEGTEGGQYKNAQVEATENLLHFVDELGKLFDEIASDLLKPNQ